MKSLARFVSALGIVRPIRVITLTLALLAVSTQAWGQLTLAGWEVTGQSSQATNPLGASTLDTNISSASLTLGNGVTTSNASNTFGGSNFDNTSLADSITNGDYISFTVTSAAGYLLNVSTITVNSGIATALNNDAFHVDLLSSATGFTAQNSLYSYSFSNASPPAQSITLSSIPELQNVNGSVEFRLYGWKDIAGTATFRIRSMSGNDLVITGSTSLSAVPEPSTYAALLGGLVLLGVMAWRRKQALAQN